MIVVLVIDSLLDYVGYRCARDGLQASDHNNVQR
jgi:hypothetical protein